MRTTDGTYTDTPDCEQVAFEERHLAIHEMLLSWDGIPRAHSGSDPWIEFCYDAARKVGDQLRQQGLDGLRGDAELGREQRRRLYEWADGLAAWESCGESNRRNTADLVAALDLAGRSKWLASAETPLVDAAADRQPTPLLAELGRAAGKARFLGYVACIRIYSFGDDTERGLILHPDR